MTLNPVKLAAAIQTQFKYHGWRFPFIAIDRLGTYWYRRWFGAKTFTFQGKTYSYFHHPYVLHVERIVESALVAELLQEYRDRDILEVGNVLWHYFPIHHDVVDKYEKSPNVMNDDIVDYHPSKRYDLIITLSTLEHVGWDEQPKEKDKVLRAIANLKSLLKDGGRLIATVPIAYNPYLDEYIKSGQTGFSEVHFLKRISKDNRWQEASLTEVQGLKFGEPYPCANGLAVGYYTHQASL